MSRACAPLDLTLDDAYEGLEILGMNERRPRVEPVGKIGQLRADIFVGPEVGHGEPLRPPAQQLLDRGVPSLDVDIRRRGGRDGQGLGLDSDAAHISHESRPPMQIGDVVGGVTGRVGDFEAAVEEPLASAEDAQIRLGHRENLAPEALHVVAVQPPRTLEQARRIYQMRSALLMHVDLEVGPALHQRARSARVVEVDMGQKQRPRRLLDRRQQCLQARRGPRIDQDVVDLPAADHPLNAEVVKVNHLDSRQLEHGRGLLRAVHRARTGERAADGEVWASYRGLNFALIGGEILGGEIVLETREPVIAHIRADLMPFRVWPRRLPGVGLAENACLRLDFGGRLGLVESRPFVLRLGWDGLIRLARSRELGSRGGCQVSAARTG